MKYSVRKINLFPIAKFGCWLGGLAMILPGIICALIVVQGVSIVRSTLNGWATAELESLLGDIPFDFIALLGLESLQQLIIQLDNQWYILMLLIMLSFTMGGGIFIGGTVWMLGGVYNVLAKATGGIEVELKSK